MAVWKIFCVVLTASTVVYASELHGAPSHLQKRALSTHICEPVNNTNKVQCYCARNKKDSTLISSADCYLTKQTVPPDDKIWTMFKTLGPLPKLSLLNTRGIPMTYIPTVALKETTALKKLEVKYGLLNTIEAYAFANLSSLQDITLRDNQIVKLDEFAFSHHANLKIINLDTNSLTEINRNVFVDLPSLEKLFLTNNQISTIHDKAFINLVNLKELEIDRNKIFSLNNAVFEGLKNLERLDLSSNSLEVIGDNTFQALTKLTMLNLEENSIQMMDEKAFFGLGSLQVLSLAHNKLTDIDNVKVFEGMKSLISLKLKGNQLSALKYEVMAPILSNFYANNTNFDVEDNNFPCDCQLDWFIDLKNKTLNKYLQITIENLKCNPDAALKEAWTNTVKNAPQSFEEELEPKGDYEYYDDSQLNGKLFYVDVRDLLKCDNATKSNKADELTKEIPTLNDNTVTTHKPTEGSTWQTTHKIETTEMNTRMKIETNKQEFTTTRLATVSAKPVEAKIYENMASDEAKPEKIKAHRSVQEETKNPRRDSHTSSAVEKMASRKLLILMVLTCFRLQI